MMEWTDRHCRYVHRMLAPRATLFTEMVTTGAILHGDRDRFLALAAPDPATILQLGGSEPVALAEAVRIAEHYGYAGFDLNCGCPSPRVQKGSFGACLMAEPDLVADCVRAMIEATAKPVSVKCRLGIGDVDTGLFLDRFVDAVAEAGCRTFTLHARKAWLTGLSPKDNREIPPLDYDRVVRLKARRPDLWVVLNGGLKDPGVAAGFFAELDGVMIGREAYQNPLSLPLFEAALFDNPAPDSTLAFERVVDGLRSYLERLDLTGGSPSWVLRHVLGLANGRPGARRFRRVLSERMRETGNGATVFEQALSALDEPSRDRVAA